MKEIDLKHNPMNLKMVPNIVVSFSNIEQDDMSCIKWTKRENIDDWGTLSEKDKILFPIYPWFGETPKWKKFSVNSNMLKIPKKNARTLCLVLALFINKYMAMMLKTRN